ncbi:hypothetical protein Glo7428_5098 (plasmid) [Gloeocapsa sp. PCC 7428]|nr:hypothetical protein Glo7428_5098 [Gloeocapsa sp. PCC 7428]
MFITVGLIIIVISLYQKLSKHLKEVKDEKAE